MILEFLTWLQLENVKSLADLDQSRAASNLILFCYLVALLIDKRCIFIVVFLICETMAYSGLLNELSSFMYYIVFAGIYSSLYYYLYFTKARIKTVFACGLIILFGAGSAIDAVIYPTDETVFYKCYELFAVAVHLYFLYTLINWKVLRSAMGASISKFFGAVGVNYNLPFICYTYNIFIKRD